MFNLAAPTLPLPGGVLADLKLPGAVAPAENGGFADILALQVTPELQAVAPADALAEIAVPSLPATEAATAVPASGNILPVSAATLPQAFALPPLGATPEMPTGQPIETQTQPALVRTAAIALQFIAATDAAEPALPAEPGADAAQHPVKAHEFVAPPGTLQSASKPAKAEPGRLAKLKPEESEESDPVVAQQSETLEIAVLGAGNVAQPGALPIHAAASRQEPSEQGAANSEPQYAAPASPRTVTTPVSVPKRGEQPRPALQQLAGAQAAIEQSPLRIIEAKPDQRAAAMPMAAVIGEAPLSPAAPTSQRLRVVQGRTTTPVEASPGQVPQPLSAPTSPVLAEPVVVAAPTASAERPVDFAQLVDRLVAAREAASPQGVSLAVHHADFGKVSLRFDSDGAGLQVAMSAADPDFARAVAVAAPVGSANAGNDPLPQRSQPEQQHMTGQGPSQQQGSPQPRGADPRSARTQTSNPAPDTSDERSPARRGLFA